MFGLPDFTVAVMLGIPLFWIAYTAVFLFRSRDWHLQDEED